METPTLAAPEEHPLAAEGEAFTVTFVGLGVNVALAVAKVLIGLAFGSATLLADGIHSAGDLVSDIALLAGLNVSHKEADVSHPYGHRRVQTLVALFIGLLVVGSAAGVVYTAARRWIEGVPIAYGWIPFAVALVSVLSKELVFRATRRVGRRTGDTAVLANAWHHRTDAFSSLAAAVGMFGVALGGADWGFLDSLTAIALGGALVTMGSKLVFTAGQELIDRAPSRTVLDNIAAVVARTEGVRTYHAFRMRQSAGKLEMDVHIQVDPALSVGEGHDIATEVRRRIMEADPNVTTVTVHVEPAEDW
ncbi:MAG: cation diffusion facilitator family transporter [Planctomycetota bacterium]